MSKKLNWLDKFAQEQASKMEKVASSTKIAAGEDVIVNPEDVPGATDGSMIEFNGEQFEVVNANYNDESGPGVVLRAAAYEDVKGDPMGVAMGVPAGSVSPAPAGQEYARTDANTTQQTYTNDEDAQWGSSSAPATEQQVAGENAVDRTTIPGKFTQSPELNSGGAPVVDAVPTGDVAVEPAQGDVVDAPAVETVDAPVTDVPVEETHEVPADEVTEDVTTEEVPEEEKEEKVANRILARIIAKQGK